MSNLLYHTKRIKNPLYPLLATQCIETYRRLKKRRPDAVIDIGSSVGALLRELEQLQDWLSIAGVEKSRKAIRRWQPTTAVCIELDIDKFSSALSTYRFDLVTTFEVAEHIRNTDKMVRLINSVSHEQTILIFSAAHPGQPGKGHINCKSGREWIYILERCRWAYDHYATALFHADIGSANHQDPIIPKCYLNTMVFQKV